MKKAKKLLSVFLIMITLFSLIPQTTAKAADAKITTATELVKDMGLGWNLGNSLDAVNKNLGYYYATETIWGNPETSKQLIDAVAEAGFGAIRIPVTWYNHIDSSGTIDPAWLQRVAQIADYALDNQLYVIINVHHDTGMDWSYHWIYADTDTYEQSKKDFLNIWKQIADYFRNYDNRLLFEATNEIMNTNHSWDWGVSWKDFRMVHDLDQEFIDTVRDSGGNNKDRFLVLSTWGASSDDCQIEQLFYKDFVDSSTNKLILSVHNYTTSTSTIKSVISSLKNYSQKYEIPVIIDEFGTTSSMLESNRISVAKTYVETARTAGITCFWWDNGGDYSLFDRSTSKVKYPKLVKVLMEAAGISVTEKKEDIVDSTVIPPTGNETASDTYTNLEYLDSTGKNAAFSDKKAVIDEDCSFELKLAPTSYRYSSWLYTKHFQLRLESTYGLYEAYSWWADKIYSPSIGETLTIKELAGRTYINGKLVQDASRLGISYSDTGITMNIGHTKFYYLKITDKNGTLIRHYLPVKDYNGVSCLYDTMTNTFYYCK